MPGRWSGGGKAFRLTSPKQVSAKVSGKVDNSYPTGYKMVEIRQSPVFVAWLFRLKNSLARGQIVARIQRMKFGHFGDVKSVGDGVYEMRMDVGPGYRIYYERAGNNVVLPLCGGDKGSQKRDISRAKMMILGGWE
jgi:putative addiction module killer protein